MKYTGHQELFPNADTGTNLRDGVVSPLLAHMRESSMIADVFDVRNENTKSIFYGFTTNGFSSVAANKPYYMLPDESLSNSVITTIEVVDYTTLISMKTAAGARDNLSSAILSKATFYVCNKAGDILATLPFTSMILHLQGGRPAMAIFDNIEWMNCYFMFSSVAGISAANGVALRVGYSIKN